MEFEKKERIEIDGFISNGKQYDLDIQLPEDNRNVIFGIVKDSYGEVLADAVVKLLEIEKDKFSSIRKPVSHTFTDENGQFVFGPLCPNKKYAIEIWANKVDHIKICEACKRKGKCLKGVNLDCDKHCEVEFEESLEEDCKEEIID